MRKAWLLLFVALLSIPMFCPGASAAETVKAYTTLEEPNAKELFDAFEKDTGIHVEWVRLTTGEALARIEAEKNNPQAAIWVGGVGTLHIEAKTKGLTTPYSSRSANTIPDRYRDKDRYWIGLYVGPIAFGMNTNRAKELKLKMPKKWSDLVKPEYAKKVRMANPGTSGTAYNVLTNIIRIHGGNEDKAFAFLKQLDRSVDQYTKSGSAPGKSAAIGEIPIAIGYLHDLIKLKKGGAPLEIAIPSDGTGFETASMSLIRGAPGSLNAKKLYDWILTKKGMTVVANWYVIPLSSEAPKVDTGFDLSKMNLVHQDDAWDAANKARLVERWNKEIAPK